MTVAGCSEPTTAPSRIAPSSRASIASQSSAEATNLALITRAIALSLRDPALRQQLLGDLRRSRVTPEHKLQLENYLRSDSGVTLIKGIAKARGTSSVDVLTLVRSMRSMEFYMPVAAHRAAWTGDGDLIVAAQLREDEDPVGFRLDGSAVALSDKVPPATPVLAIVPAESDFSRDLPVEWQNGDDQGGRSIGTLVPPRARAGAKVTSLPTSDRVSSSPNLVQASADCDPLTVVTECDSPVSGGSTPYPGGVYLNYARLADLGETWIRGEPEIELFVIGPTYNPDANGEMISCSGQNGPGLKWYDQNMSEYFPPPNAPEAQILSRDEIDRYYQIYRAPYAIQIWEDDQTPCEIVSSGRSTLQQLFDNLRAAQRATTLIIQVLSGTQDLAIAAANGNAIRTALAGVFQSDDDFLGNVVLTPGTATTDSNGDGYVDADLAIPGGSNGMVRLRTVNSVP